MDEEKIVDAVISTTHDLFVQHNYSTSDNDARYTCIWKKFRAYAK